MSAEKADWIKGVKWSLSGSHPKIDICDTWASQDLYGMGPGVYPPRDAPIDHPNGLCHTLDVLVSRAELVEILKAA